MKRLWWLIMVLLLIASCTRRVYVPLVHEVRDSISVHDTTYQVELVPYRDSVVTESDSSYLENAYAYSWAVWKSGKLHHSLVVWPQAKTTVKVPYFVDRYVTVKEPQPYEVQVERKLTLWERVKLRLGGLTLLVCVFYGVIKLVRKWIRMN